jgi:hypothetical protein
MNRLRRLWDSHPNLLSWALLAAGMVIIVVLSARSVGFQPGQWAALIIATIGLAGLCVWILTWEQDEEEEERPAMARDQLEAGAQGGAEQDESMRERS